MRIGLIVECTIDGVEEKLCPKILQLVSDETGIEIECTVETMVKKPILLREAASVTANLLAEGVDLVVILWDENPPWTPDEDFAQTRCWHHEREHLVSTLVGANIELGKVKLVCIEHEIETWILHDHKLISETMSTSHKAKIKKISDPLAIDSPKRFLIQLYKKNKFHFNVAQAASGFAKNLGDLTHFKKCDTFRYFVQSVLGEMPEGWAPYVYKSKGPKDK